MNLVEELKRAYQARKLAADLLFNVGEGQIKAAHELRIAESTLIAAGLEGANEKERMANLVLALLEQREALMSHEKALRLAKLSYDQASRDFNYYALLYSHGASFSKEPPQEGLQ